MDTYKIIEAFLYRTVHLLAVDENEDWPVVLVVATLGDRLRENLDSYALQIFGEWAKMNRII